MKEVKLKSQEKYPHEIQILYGKVRKMRNEMKRNLKRTLKLEKQKPDMQLYLSNYFVNLDKAEQRLIELKQPINGCIREFPEVLELVISKFGPKELIEDAAIRTD